MHFWSLKKNLLSIKKKFLSFIIFNVKKAVNVVAIKILIKCLQKQL